MKKFRYTERPYVRIGTGNYRLRVLNTSNDPASCSESDNSLGLRYEWSRNQAGSGLG